MRLECESCREIGVARFEIAGDVVHATCAVCQHVMIAQTSPAAAPSDAPLCPKCSAPRRDATSACASCGLVADRMAAFSEARDAAVPGPVRDAWMHATEHWTDAAGHDEMLRLAAAHNAYAWTAGRYRTRRRDTIAQRQLDRLGRAAEATLLAGATGRTEAATGPYRASRSVLAILIVAIVAGLLYATLIRGNRPAPRAPAIPVKPLSPGHPVSPSTIR